MLNRINARLEAEGIRPVEMIILKWRASQLLRDIQRKFSKCRRICLYTVAFKETDGATSLQCAVS